MPKHVVRKGESVISLSKQYGLPVDKIWDHPGNRALRERGRKPSVLYEGDELNIPDLEIHEEPCATERRHRFRRLASTVQLKVRFLRRGSPRADESYVLSVDGKLSQGNLDGGGWLRAAVPADSREATVCLGEDDKKETYHLKVGVLDPVSEISGVQQRLNNLGYACGSRGEGRNLAIKRFQADNGLAETGEIDQQTRDRLTQKHGA